jgi:hypothetical protein
MTCKICGNVLVLAARDGMCVTCAEGASLETLDLSQPTLIRTYSGDQIAASRQFQKEAEVLSAKGYVPVSQSYQPGSWGCGAFLAALVFALVFIGIIVLIYMLIVKPAGTLTVTYELRGTQPDVGEIKVCPACAEEVKEAAKICRFCRYEFDSDGSSTSRT